MRIALEVGRRVAKGWKGFKEITTPGLWHISPIGRWIWYSRTILVSVFVAWVTCIAWIALRSCRSIVERLLWPCGVVWLKISKSGWFYTGASHLQELLSELRMTMMANTSTWSTLMTKEADLLRPPPRGSICRSSIATGDIPPDKTLEN